MSNVPLGRNDPPGPPSAITPDTAKLAALYARRTNLNDDAIGDQYRASSQRAALDGWHAPDSPHFRFGDDHVSGERTARGGLDALMALVMSGDAPFKRVYVRERGRLARASDPRFIYWVEYTCKRFGIQLCYSNDRKHLDYSDSNDKSEVVAAFVTSAVDNIHTHNELRGIQERTRNGTRAHVTKQFFVGAKAPYGTERWLVHSATGTFLEPVPLNGTIRRTGYRYRLRWTESAFDAIRSLFDGIENGRSLSQVAADLAADGFSPPGGAGWCRQAVWRIARNPLYKGDWHFGRTNGGDAPVESDEANVMGTGAIYVRNFLPGAPVSAVQWDLVQRILEGQQETAQKRRASRPEYVLTGRLQCADCGARLHGHTSPREKGSVRMYRHEPPRRHGAEACAHTNRYLRAQPLEEAALGLTERCLAANVLERLAREEIERKEGELATPIRAREIATQRKNIERLERAAANGSRRELEAETVEQAAVYRRSVQELTAEVQVARTRLATLESAEALMAATARLPKVSERVLELRKIWDGDTPAERKRVVAALLESVAVNFGEGRVEMRVRAVR